MEEEWYANERFWETFYPYLFTPQRWERTIGEVENVLALAQPGGKRVLDLCCGPGRHSLELARRGFQVTGVDCSPSLLVRAREASAKENLAIEWVQDDMRRFTRPNAFDLALNLFTSFGY